MVRAPKKKLPRTAQDLAALRDAEAQLRDVNAALLKSWRTDADITQAQMGFALDVSHDTIYNIERGKAPISLELSVTWARLTGRNFHDYMEELHWATRKLYPPPQKS